MKLLTKCAAVFALVATAMPVTDTARVSAATITSWKTVRMDTFNSGGLPAHWKAYNGPYGSGVKSCAAPSHSTVSGGYLHLKFFYEKSTAGKCGAGWYSGGVRLSNTYSGVSQRVTIRFRVVQTGGVAAHRIIPMRWPDSGSGLGEEDFCESTSTVNCYTYMHWRNYSGRNHKKYLVDLSQWHTFQVEHNGSAVHVKIDGVARWDFSGTSTSVPPTRKHVVLQQECDKYGCPTGKTGMEDIQIDWIRVENPV